MTRDYWTPGARHCYEIKSDCGRCYIPAMYPELTCQMQQSVADLLERLGTPDHVKSLIKKKHSVVFDEVVQYLREHPRASTVEIAEALSHRTKTSVAHILLLLYRKCIANRVDVREVVRPGGQVRHTHRWWLLVEYVDPCTMYNP